MKSLNVARSPIKMVASVFTSHCFISLFFWLKRFCNYFTLLNQCKSIITYTQINALRSNVGNLHVFENLSNHIKPPLNRNTIL